MSWRCVSGIERYFRSKRGDVNNAYIPQHVSLKVEEGEVLGIAGLVGAGRTELVRMIFGEMPIGSGEIFVSGGKSTDKK